MSQKTELQSNNTDIQAILSKVNGLPSGAALGDATAADVAAGKTFSSASGIKVTGTAKLASVQTFEGEMNLQYERIYNTNGGAPPVPAVIDVGFKPDIFFLQRKYPSSGYWNYGGYDALSHFFESTIRPIGTTTGVNFTPTDTGVTISADANYAGTKISGDYIVRALKYT